MSEREETKAIETIKKIIVQAKSVEDKLDAARTLQQVAQQQQVVAQDFQHTLHSSLDTTNENVEKSIDESRT